MGGGSDTKKSNPSDAAGRGWHYRLRGKGGGEPLVANGASEATEVEVNSKLPGYFPSTNRVASSLTGIPLASVDGAESK
jgi:hypothetical protein